MENIMGRNIGQPIFPFLDLESDKTGLHGNRENLQNCKIVSLHLAVGIYRQPLQMHFWQGL